MSHVQFHETIPEHFVKCGYKLPKDVFWKYVFIIIFVVDDDAFYNYRKKKYFH